MRLIIENVRCFYGRHEISLKPLTLLVGENSSGKTSALAMMAAASNLNTYTLRPEFSIPPFDLGLFDIIASRGQNECADARHFGIGFVEEGSDRQRLGEVYATFHENDGNVELKAWRMSTSDLRIRLDVQKTGAVATVTSLGSKKATKSKIPQDVLEILPVPILVFPVVREANKQQHTTETKKPDIAKAFVKPLPDWLPRVSAVAPIRMKPRRIYEVTKQVAPEGDHIPFLLAEICEQAKRGDKKAKQILETLQTFGEESGLFRNVDTKRLEQRAGAPFRLLVDSDGLESTVADVGYGVSQVLPVLLEGISGDEGTWVLLQQPEVHLHPRAQAALGSLFAKVVAEHKKRMVIETHSDYIVDRVRQEVARGTVPHDDVGILFFERIGGRTQAHPIELDEMGDLVDPPEGYRQFFLEEELSLMRAGGV